MKRIARALAIVVATIAIPTAVIAAEQFQDVTDDNVFVDDIAWLAERDITRGCNPPDNDRFCPADNVTREQMAAFMHRLSDSVLTEAVIGGSTPLEEELAQATRAAAAYQDVAAAEAAGYASSLNTLGCFEDPDEGGMGLHYIEDSLLDAQVSVAEPEALVYELDIDGNITGLVAHEYIVPVDAWTAPEPPMLFGHHFHRHPVLPLWVLHSWLWKDNPNGLFQDYNPKVRLCPENVPVFGEDLP